MSAFFYAHFPAEARHGAAGRNRKDGGKMAVTKGWLDRSGVKLSVEDIYQMQLVYEQPGDSMGPLVGTRSFYLSEKGSLYQCVEYYDKDKVNDIYPEGVELALNADEVEKLRSGDKRYRDSESYQSLSETQKAAIWSYFMDPEKFKTVHKETKEVKDYKEVTIKFGKGCMKEFEGQGKDGQPEKFAEIRFKDGEQWKSFVVPRKYVHDNQFGNGLWMKRDANGRTKVRYYDSEKKENIEEWMSNKDLKAKVESYKKKKKSR